MEEKCSKRIEGSAHEALQGCGIHKWEDDRWYRDAGQRTEGTKRIKSREKTWNNQREDACGHKHFPKRVDTSHNGSIAAVEAERGGRKGDGEVTCG
jgi:uncharacterized OB-fold protein